MKKQIIKSVLIVAMMVSASFSASYSQCSVCRAGAESSVEQGHKVGKGLNTGIIYLMSIPYALGGVALYIYIRNRKRS